MSLMDRDQDIFVLKRDYVYVPAALLIGGTMMIKKDWTIYAALISIAFAAWNLNRIREQALRYSFELLLTALSRY